MANNKGTKKYRPYFTLEELEWICRETSSQGIRRYLTKFIRDVHEGYTISGVIVKDPLDVSLGFKEKRIADYDKIQQQRYINDEMSSEEEREYERSQGVKI